MEDGEAEEALMEAIEESDHESEEDDDMDEPNPFLTRQRAYKRNMGSISRFLGNARQLHFPVVRPLYYRGLLAWGLQRHIENDSWKVVRTLGHIRATPIFREVNIDYGKYENLLYSGSYLLQNEGRRIAVTISAVDPTEPATLVITCCGKKEGETFAKAVEAVAQPRNLYHGKTLQFAGPINFLNVPHKCWDDVVLEARFKDQIERNTVGFLNRIPEMAKYGIPPRRGILLIGNPGTGKTLITKILMTESAEITSILAHPGGLTQGAYIADLYQLAADLKPALVFIEDLELIGMDRRSFRNATRDEALCALLSCLDGVEQCESVATVATVNSFEDLDKALKARPSRFDRKIHLPLPAMEQRRELIRSLARKIPISEEAQEHMARKTHDYTPAQLQEAAYGLVIDHTHSPLSKESGDYYKFGIAEVDSVLEEIAGDNRPLGFSKPGGDGNGSGVDAVTPFTARC